MKNKYVNSIVISIIVTVIGLIINLICALAFEILPLGFNMGGGDAIIKSGFGIDLVEHVPQVRTDQLVKTQYSIEFDFISFIVCLFIIYIIILAIKTIIERKKH